MSGLHWQLDLLDTQQPSAIASSHTVCNSLHSLALGFLGLLSLTSLRVPASNVDVLLSRFPKYHRAIATRTLDTQCTHILKLSAIIPRCKTLGHKQRLMNQNKDLCCKKVSIHTTSLSCDFSGSTCRRRMSGFYLPR